MYYEGIIINYVAIEILMEIQSLKYDNWEWIVCVEPYITENLKHIMSVRGGYLD